MFTFWKESYNKPRQCIKKQSVTLPTKTCIVKAMVFPVVMCKCESGTIKKSKCQRINAFELWCWRRLLSLLDNMEIKPASPKENQSWTFIGRTDTEAEAPMLWPSVVKSRLIGKDPDAGKDWWQEEKGTTEDEMVGWHHQCNRQESEQNTLGDSEGQGSLECCSPWVAKSQTQLSNWTCVSELSRMVAVSYSEC